MPRKGYSQITVPDPLKESLSQEAQTRGVSVPVLLKQLLSDNQSPAGESMRVGWISPRVARIVLYASNVFNLNPTQTLEKLIDRPAGSPLPTSPMPASPTHKDLIQKGLKLIKDLNPTEAKNLQWALQEIRKKRVELCST